MDVERLIALRKLSEFIGYNKSILERLSIGALRVLVLLSDERWHTVEEICVAAGSNNRIATEGMRRLREARSRGITIEDRRVGTIYEYKLWIMRCQPSGETESNSSSGCSSANQRTYPIALRK